MSKHICIVGGSGFVGRAIAQQAVERHYRVTIACRHPERARDMQVKGMRLVKADICSGRGLDEAIQDSDCVINLVGLLFERGAQNFSAAHVHGTEHLLAACERANVQQYLHMSALGADLGSLSNYARSKAEAEQRVRQTQLAWTIMRPSIIYGEHDSFFNRFRSLYAAAPVAPLIGADTRFQPVWVEDVARAFVASIGNRDVQGQIFELGGPDIYSLRQLIEMMLAELGWQRLLLPAPAFVASLMARVMQFLPTPPLTPDQLILLKQDNVLHDTSFPAIFGQPAALSETLPAVLKPDAATVLQQRLDDDRKQFWANM
ncbi:MAG: complex I NDUFA9 subunit family protein [Mariprofundaceae bacterium]